MLGGKRPREWITELMVAAAWTICNSSACLTIKRTKHGFHPAVCFFNRLVSVCMSTVCVCVQLIRVCLFLVGLFLIRSLHFHGYSMLQALHQMWTCLCVSQGEGEKGREIEKEGKREKEWLSEQYIIMDSCTESKWRMEAGSTSGEPTLYSTW